MGPVEVGFGVALMGFCCVLPALLISPQLFNVKVRRMALGFFVGALFLIGGGLIALGGWLAGWWGQ
jgi:hypothetical protein